MLDILLINLPINTWYKEKMIEKNSMPPLGILYIATYLQNNGFKVKVIDFSVEIIKLDEFKEMLVELNPKIIGMSTYNETWEAQKTLCKIIKNINPNILIISGGAFATFCYEDILNQSLTDYIVRGEGEDTFLNLCKYIFSDKEKSDYPDFTGICYKDMDNNIVVNKELIRIIDLDKLPFPNRDLIDINKYTMPYTISTSRGCPGNCIFCSSKSFWGHKVIMRSAKSVFEEVIYLHNRYGTNIFSIVDDTFTALKKRCYEFCDMIKNSGINFLWECESRADVIDDDFIRVLYDAGCHKIQFGMESADNNILKKLKKNVTVEQIESAVKYAYKYGMHIQTSYIIGHAFDTEETIKKTIEFAKYLKKTYGVRAVCSVNTPFPGTEQFNRRKELGIEIKTNDWEKFVLSNPVISTKELSTNQLRYYLELAQQ